MSETYLGYEITERSTTDGGWNISRNGEFVDLVLGDIEQARAVCRDLYTDLPAFEQQKTHVGKGWLPIVERINEQLMALDPDYGILQIKEKFGGLRYYAARSGNTPYTDNDPFWEIINNGEAESFLTCEECGTKENVTTGVLEPGVSYGWIKTLCAEDRVKQVEELKRRRGEL